MKTIKQINNLKFEMKRFIKFLANIVVTN